jgi:predicted TPR repeat methyltransferase
MATQLKTRIGENWVKNPNRAIADIEAEFDECAGEYERSSLLWDYRGARDGGAFFAEHVAVTSRVLDAGCGTGLVGRELAERGFADLTGCDISEAMLRLARAKRIYHGGLFKADIRRMPFEPQEFDALVCIAVLTYADALEPVFAEFDRVVRPGGTIAFSHRVDLEGSCGFADALDRRLADGRWRRIAVTPPQLYYPGKDDYRYEITVRYHAYWRL